LTPEVGYDKKLQCQSLSSGLSNIYIGKNAPKQLALTNLVSFLNLSLIIKGTPQKVLKFTTKMYFECSRKFKNINNL
jgi:hypothetical protein